MKKGFTLIELLAVVVILSVIALISVPIVLDIIEKSKWEVYDSNIENVEKATLNYLSIEKDGVDLKIGETLEISINDLKTKGYIKNIFSPVNGEACTGYISVFRPNEDDYKINPNLKCESNISSSTDDELKLYLTFDDFQEPTKNMFFGNNIIVDTYDTTSGSDEIGDYYTKVSDFTRWYAGLRIPYIPVEAGKTYTYTFEIMSDVSFPLRIDSNVSYTGYTSNDAGFSSQNMIAENYVEAGKWQKVGKTFTLIDGIENAILSTSFCPYSAEMLDHKIYYRNFQLEEKTYDTPYTVNERMGALNNQILGGSLLPLDVDITPTWKSDGKYYFDGINDEIKIVANPNYNSNEYTISTKIKLNQIPTEGNVGAIVVEKYGSVNGWFLSILNTGKLHFRSHDGTNSYQTTSTKTLEVDKEYLITATIAEGIQKIYINGELETETNIPGYLDSNTEIRIGSWGDGAHYYLNGELDDVKLHTRALSDSEIKSEYLTAFDE